MKKKKIIKAKDIMIVKAVEKIRILKDDNVMLKSLISKKELDLGGLNGLLNSYRANDRHDRAKIGKLEHELISKEQVISGNFRMIEELRKDIKKLENENAQLKISEPVYKHCVTFDLSKTERGEQKTRLKLDEEFKTRTKHLKRALEKAQEVFDKIIGLANTKEQKIQLDEEPPDYTRGLKKEIDYILSDIRKREAKSVWIVQGEKPLTIYGAFDTEEKADRYKGTSHMVVVQLAVE